MNRFTITTILASTLLATSLSAGPINISKEWYIEDRSIETLMDGDQQGGTLLVRPHLCNDCTAKAYRFDTTLRVIYKDKDQSLNTLNRWHNFKGDIVISKATGQLVAVKRNR